MIGINAEVTRDYYQPPEPVVAAHCDECGGEIYDRSTYYEIPQFGLRPDRKICEDCIDDVIVNEFENMDFGSRLEAIGGQTRIAQQEEW